MLLLISLARKDKIQAIGEIGLVFVSFGGREEQRYWFRAPNPAANKLRMPIVVHSEKQIRGKLWIFSREGHFVMRVWMVSEEKDRITVEAKMRVLLPLPLLSGSRTCGFQYKLGATISILAGPVT